MSKALNFLSKAKLVLNSNLYQRRNWFLVNENKGFINRIRLSSLCKVKVLKDKWVYDTACNMAFDVNSDIGKEIYYTGKFEETEINFLKKTVLSANEQPVILDIGANVGFHSIQFADFLKKATIYAFEPSPFTREILKYNIIKNKKEKSIHIIPFALSNHSGKGIFYQAADDGYSSLKDTKRKDILQTVEVDLIKLDQFVANNKLNKVDFIKIDVEGFENEVIEGALETLKKFQPDIFLEIYKGTNSNLNPELTVDVLKNIGYNVYVLKDGLPKPFVAHSDNYYNYFFTTKDNLQLL